MTNGSVEPGAVIVSFSIALERRDVYLMFKTMDQDRKGFLSQEDFLQVYEASMLSWEASSVRRAIKSLAVLCFIESLSSREGNKSICTVSSIAAGHISIVVKGYEFIFLPEKMVRFSMV